MAKIIFHEVLDDGIDASDLFIKYHFKRLDGTLFWAGLTATKDSAVNWNHIMDSMGVNVPEIGVFIGNPSRGIMRFYNSVSSTFSEDRVPSTYEVGLTKTSYRRPFEFNAELKLHLQTCLKQACEVERGLTDSARSGKHTVLIWSPKPVASWVVLPPSDYRGAVKRYTFKFAQENKTGPKVDAVAVKLQLAQ